MRGLTTMVVVLHLGYSITENCRKPSEKFEFYDFLAPKMGASWSFLGYKRDSL